MIGVVLVRSDLTHHSSVTYLLPTILRNIFKCYYLKGVCALNTLLLFSTCAATDTLENPTKCIEIGCVPNLLYFGWQRSWLYFSDSPVSLSKTGIYVCSSGLGVHHKLRIFVGCFLCSSSTGWTPKACWVVCYIVQCTTGCSVTVAGSNRFGFDW